MRRNLRSHASPACRAHGHTMLELVGIALAVLLLIACALPILRWHSRHNGERQSQANLRRIAIAHQSYAEAYSGRQFTAIPEDASRVDGLCSAYLARIACPPPLILGVSGGRVGTEEEKSGRAWGYFLSPTGYCAESPYRGDCDNWSMYKPIEFHGARAGVGSFRLSNCKAINAFLDGRFLSDVHYSPNDTYVYRSTEEYRRQGVDFAPNLAPHLAELPFSSYCLSPAAMWHTDVLAREWQGFRDPNQFIDGYVSPTVALCAYPDLKTRVIEHHWNLDPPEGAPIPTLPAAGKDVPRAWTFNASRANAPYALFFDGRVDRIRNQQAIDDDRAAFIASGEGLWSRTTPFGPRGYERCETLDERTSHTILTTDGIRGRDILRAEAQGPERTVRSDAR